MFPRYLLVRRKRSELTWEEERINSDFVHMTILRGVLHPNKDGEEQTPGPSAQNVRSEPNYVRLLRPSVRA